MTHYLIDGYNWLFRSIKSREEENLRGEREALIKELVSRLSLAKMQATLIFDAQFNPSPAATSYSKGISICYTNEGETADEYILELIKHSSNPKEYTIITSDQRLAWHVRQKSAHTLSIHEFKKMLHRICFKKLKPKPPIEKPPQKKALMPKKTLQDRYEEIFEEKLEPSPKKYKAQKKEESMSDFERWLKIFEGDGV